MPPSVQSLHIDQYLTNLSVDFVQDEEVFVHNEAFPVVPVQKQSDKFVIYDRGDYLHGDIPERPLGGEAETADWGKSDGTYRCVERALGHYVDDRQRANADDPMDLEERAMELLTRNFMVHNDQVWQSTYFKTGVWDRDVTGVTASPSSSQLLQWDQSSSTPINDIEQEKETMQENSLLRPNTLIAGAKVHRVAKTNSEIREYVKYTQGGVPDEALLAQLFGLDNYVVARSVENTADRGQSTSESFIFEKTDALLVHAADNPGLNTPSAGYTFAWTGLIPGATNAMGGVMQTGRDEKAHSDWYEMRIAQDINLVSSALGTFLDDVTS